MDIAANDDRRGSDPRCPVGHAGSSVCAPPNPQRSDKATDPDGNGSGQTDQPGGELHPTSPGVQPHLTSMLSHQAAAPSPAPAPEPLWFWIQHWQTGSLGVPFP